MNTRLWMAAVGLATAGPAMAGPTVPLGQPLGLTLGSVLGTPLGGLLGGVLGLPLGDVLPAGSAVLVVAAVSLGLGILIARRKRHR